MSSNGVEGSNNNVSTNASPLTSSEKRVTIITETHPPSPSTTNVEQASLAESLIRGNQELRANVASNFIKKGLIGMGLGLATGIFIFKRKAVPTMFCTGFGLGMAYNEGRQIVRDYHEIIRQTSADPMRHCPFSSPRNPPS